MAISVLFPDGSYSSVPGQLIGRSSNGGIVFDSFRQVPLNCNPLWRFVCEEGVWRAKPRHGPDLTHLPAREEPCWWEGISQISDSGTLGGLDADSLKTAA